MNLLSLEPNFKLCMALSKLIAWMTALPEKQHASQSPAQCASKISPCNGLVALADAVAMRHHVERHPAAPTCQGNEARTVAMKKVRNDEQARTAQASEKLVGVREVGHGIPCRFINNDVLWSNASSFVVARKALPFR